MEYEQKDLMTNIREIKGYVNGMQYVADQRKIEFDAWSMYRTFYSQQPSYKHLIREPSYDQKMTEKYDCCIDQINPVLESKILFDKKYNTWTVGKED